MCLLTLAAHLKHQPPFERLMSWRGDLFSLKSQLLTSFSSRAVLTRKRNTWQWCLGIWVIVIGDKQNCKPCRNIMVILCIGGVKFLAYCTCNIISIKNTQVLVFYLAVVPRDQYVSLVYTKYKDEPGVSKVIGWLHGWKRGIYWLPTFIGLSCTNAKPASANSEHNWTADNVSWRAMWDDSELGGVLVTHFSSSLRSSAG